MRRKGQTITVEQVMLFGVGVAIFLITFYVLSAYQAYYLTSVANDLADSIKAGVAEEILLLSVKNASVASATLPIPADISGEPYRILLSPSGLHVLLTTGIFNITKSSELYRLNETFALSGLIWSSKGRITIKRSGNQITIA